MLTNKSLARLVQTCAIKLSEFRRTLLAFPSFCLLYLAGIYPDIHHSGQQSKFSSLEHQHWTVAVTNCINNRFQSAVVSLLYCVWKPHLTPTIHFLPLHRSFIWTFICNTFVTTSDTHNKLNHHHVYNCKKYLIILPRQGQHFKIHCSQTKKCRR